MSIAVRYSKLLAIWFALILAIVSCSSENGVKSADPVEQANSEDEKSSGDQKVKLTSHAKRTETPVDKKKETSSDLIGVANISSTSDGLQLDAVITEDRITSATLTVLDDSGEADQQATGKIVFRLARIDSLDGTITFLDPESRVCGEEEYPDDTEEGCDYADECYDCSIEKPLENGVATLFSDQKNPPTPYPAGEAIAVDGVEIYAEYKDQQPERKTKGRFSFEASR